MTRKDQSAAARPGLADDEPDQPDTPATLANILHWAYDAGWSVPFVDTPQARPEEWGSIRMVAQEVTSDGLVVTLDNGQVFRLTAQELTRPSGRPGRPFTLNPPGPSSTHAGLDDAALCGPDAEGEPLSPHWPQVTCRDCQAAAPTRDLSSFDDLDLAAAERQVRDVLTAAGPLPVPAYEVIRRVDRGYRAAVPTLLLQFEYQGSAELVGGPELEDTEG